MTIITLNDTPRISNLENMPRGTGARYLECTTHDDETGRHYIAMKWRRKIPAGMPPWHVLVDLSYSRRFLCSHIVEKRVLEGTP